jgi:dihydroorotate dehydrogenase
MYKLARPLLFSFDAEGAHRLGMRAARLAQSVSLGPVASVYGFEDERLRQSLWGLTFPNPVGLAAGFDKNARLVPFWEALGFGFTEVGSVTARASEGNPKPRAFRLPEDRALVNRMGLNNEGAAAVAERLAAMERGEDGAAAPRPLGVNLAKTHDPAIMGTAAIEDFRASFRALAPYASYVALNVSCPNTREGKTFEAPDAFDALLAMVEAERRDVAPGVPVLVKLSPPESTRVVFDSRLDELVQIAEARGVDGFIATNTASDRRGLSASADELERIGRGGLSGAPLAARSTALVRTLYGATAGRVPIIGVGGVDSAETAYAKVRAGASLVALYTGLVYEGPGLVPQIKRGLVRLLERDGLARLPDAVGADVRT